jgi:hypothetical protein
VLHVLRKAVGLRLDDLERAAHSALKWEGYPVGDDDAPAAILAAVDPKLSLKRAGAGEGADEQDEGKGEKSKGKRRKAVVEADGTNGGARALGHKFLKAAKKLLKAAPGRRMRAKALLAAMGEEGVDGGPGSRSELAGALQGDAKARLAMDGKDVVLMERD